MIFRQFLNEPIAAASYLIGCTATGEAAVIDPSLPASTYALFAADKGLRINSILETHMHADYFSTGRALAALTDARLYVPQLAEAQFEHTPLHDGDCVQVGNIGIRALHTPGHTPEHMAYTVTDTPRAERPWFVLTGDCLFVGDVGRADLVSLPLTGPDYLYVSIFEKLLALPDDTEVFPGHYGGSACGGKSMSGKVSSTIGFEKRFNWVLQSADRAVFSHAVQDTPREVVEAVLTHRNTNRGELPLPEDYYEQSRAGVDVAELSPASAAAALEAGDAVLIDLRPTSLFALAHPQGALNAVYARDALAGRVAALTAPDVPLILLADQPFIARVAAGMLLEEARNPLHGIVAGSFADWQRAQLPTRTLKQLTLDELHQRITQGTALVVDVRESFEWEKGTISGASQISLAQLRTQSATLPRDQLLTTVCESGMRSCMAASLLLQQGFRAVENVSPEGVSAYIRRFVDVSGAPAAA